MSPMQDLAWRQRALDPGAVAILYYGVFLPEDWETVWEHPCNQAAWWGDSTGKAVNKEVDRSLPELDRMSHRTYQAAHPWPADHLLAGGIDSYRRDILCLWHFRTQAEGGPVIMGPRGDAEKDRRFVEFVSTVIRHCNDPDKPIDFDLSPKLQLASYLDPNADGGRDSYALWGDGQWR